MALTGNMIHEAVGGSPSIINYGMFVAVFAMLALIYLTIGTVNEAFSISPFFMLAADALCTLLFLIGGIAFAAELGTHSCGNKARTKLKAYILLEINNETDWVQTELRLAQ